MHSDLLDTPRLLTDEGGNVVWRNSPDAYGSAVLTSSLGKAFNFRFPGQYYDDESGLHYNRFRYYDPGIGRYISSDPIGQNGGANVFAYALNNPVNGIDPLGLWSVSVSFFYGPGGSVTIGSDDDGYFFSVTAGVGLEAGVGFDPAGQCPIQPEDFDDPVPEDSPVGVAGYNVSAGVGLGPVSADVSATGGLGIADSEDGSLQSSAPNNVDGGISITGERGFSVSAGGHVGGNISMGGF